MHPEAHAELHPLKSNELFLVAVRQGESEGDYFVVSHRTLDSAEQSLRYNAMKYGGGNCRIVKLTLDPAWFE